MVAFSTTIVNVHSEVFSHEDAARIARQVIQHGNNPLVMIDLSRAAEATTAAFARLLLLRHELMNRGRDLQLVGLTGRVRSLYNVLHMAHLLPTAQAG